MPFRIFKLCFICLLSFTLLSSCASQVKLGYNFLDFALGWYVKKFVSLDKEQKAYAKEAIDEFHAWHRATQLPRYATYLDQVLIDMQKRPVSADYLHAESDKVQLFLDDATSHLIPSIAQVLSTLSDEQIQKMEAKLAKERQEYKEEYIDATRKKIIKKRTADVRKYMKQFFGRFTDDQKATIDQWGDKLIAYEHFALAQQEISANRVLDALRNNTQGQALEEVVRSIMFYRSDDFEPEYEKIMDFNQEITFEMLAKLFNSQTEKQQATTLKRIKRYQDDFFDLAKKGDYTTYSIDPNDELIPATIRDLTH